MTAGMVLQGRLWRFSANLNDDEVGGAVPSGAILIENVFCRIESLQPTQALLEQGLELPDMFKGMLTYYGSPLDMKTNDVLEIYHPPISFHSGKRFRIVGYRHSSQEDGRRFVEVLMRRYEDSRTEELQ